MSFMLLGILNSQAAGGGGGAFDLLETTTLTSSASSVTFSGLGAYSDYKHLQIRMVAHSEAHTGSASLFLRLNSDTGNNYSYHGLLGNGSAVSSSGVASISTFDAGQIPGSNLTNQYSATSIDLLDFQSTTKFKTFRSLSANATNQIGLRSGVWQSLSGVTSLTLTDSSGDLFTGTRASIYGVK
jgi:hypothetical protein